MAGMLIMVACAGGSGQVIQPEPKIASFASEAAAINPGEEVKLKSDFSNGSGRIVPGDLHVVSGQAVLVAPGSTTAYTLVVSNTGGQRATRTITVTVSTHNASTISMLAGQAQKGDYQKAEPGTNDGEPAFSDGKGSRARFFWPIGAAVNRNGEVLVADTFNTAIRKISPDGTVTTFAGNPGPGGDADGIGVNASFRCPVDLAVMGDQALYVTEPGCGRIRKISRDGTVVTLVAKEGDSGHGVHRGEPVIFGALGGITVDDAGTVYVLNRKERAVRKISPDGEVTTLAGPTGRASNGEGMETGAPFQDPGHLVADRVGNVYVTDRNVIRKVTPGGFVETFAGKAGPSEPATCVDGMGSEARFGILGSITMDGLGNLYVLDVENGCIRKVTPAGMVSTLLAVPSIYWSWAALAADPKGQSLYLTGRNFVAKVTL